MNLQPGTLLVSDPFLLDGSFNQSVVVLVEHRPNGSLGFVLNQASSYQLSELMEVKTELQCPVFIGGPVQQDTLHVLHKHGDLIEGSVMLPGGLSWGGDFTSILRILEAGEKPIADFRFFLGYAGWGQDQLKNEVEEKSWILGQAELSDVFTDNPDLLWQSVLGRMGTKFKLMANSPKNPQWN